MGGRLCAASCRSVGCGGYPMQEVVMERQEQDGPIAELGRSGSAARSATGLAGIPLYFCDHFIEFDGDPWASTSCKLQRGHTGDHSPLYSDERSEVRR